MNLIFEKHKYHSIIRPINNSDRVIICDNVEIIRNENQDPILPENIKKWYDYYINDGGWGLIVIWPDGSYGSGWLMDEHNSVRVGNYESKVINHELVSLNDTSCVITYTYNTDGELLNIGYIAEYLYQGENNVKS